MPVVIKKMTIAEWTAEGVRLFGVDQRKWKFVCPSCGNVQSMEDFVAAGITDHVIYNVNFNCIGRHDVKRVAHDMCSGKSPCNYTSGGLFKLGPLEVWDGKKEDGTYYGGMHMSFDFFREGETNG